jgi:hypothetical protein
MTRDGMSFFKKSDVQNHLSTRHPGTLFSTRTSTQPSPMPEGPARDEIKIISSDPKSNESPNHQ